jgi:hypothetical protein
MEKVRLSSNNLSITRRAKQKEKRLRSKKSTECSTSKVVSLFRPRIELTRKNRTNKTEVYKRASEVLDNFDISGSYCGLSAAYAPEIYEIFSPKIKGTFLNCERNTTFARQLKDFTSIIAWLYKQDFSFFEGDIFKCLSNVNNKFSIIDLDLMNCLATPKHTEKEQLSFIMQSIKNATTEKFLLILWSCYGMKVLTENQYDFQVRKTLLKKIKGSYKIMQYLPFKYCDNHIPIKAEIFALKRRRLRNGKATNISSEGSTNTLSSTEVSSQVRT